MLYLFKEDASKPVKVWDRHPEKVTKKKVVGVKVDSKGNKVPEYEDYEAYNGFITSVPKDKISQKQKEFSDGSIRPQKLIPLEFADEEYVLRRNPGLFEKAKEAK